MRDDDLLHKMMRNNPVYASMQLLSRLADTMASGGGNSLIVSGPTGIGKNWTFEQAFKRHAVRVRKIQPKSPEGLIELYRQHPRPGEILFGDEIDYIFNSEGYCNIIKQVTEKVAPGAPREIAYDVKHYARPFPIHTTTLVLTNKNFNDQTAFKSSQFYENFIMPILNRCTPFVMSFDKMAIYEYTCYLAVCEGSLKHFHFPLAVVNTALKWLATNYHRLRDVSPRMLREAATNLLDFGEEDGLAILAARLPPPPEDATAPPPAFRIQVDHPGPIGNKKPRKLQRAERRARAAAEQAQERRTAAPEPDPVAEPAGDQTAPPAPPQNVIVPMKKAAKKAAPKKKAAAKKAPAKKAPKKKAAAKKGKSHG